MSSADGRKHTLLRTSAMKVVCALLLSFALPLAAQIPDTSKFEPLLVPVFSAGAGAFGSQWTSSMVLMNSGTSAIDLARPVLSGDPRCAAICGCGATATLRPQVPAELCVAFQGAAGLILYVPRTTAEDDKSLSFHLRVRDTSRSDENAGTEVPVVRERNLRDGSPFWLLNVDTDSHFRVALRFFDIVRIDKLPVRVRVYGANGLLLETTVKLSQPIVNIVYDPFPSNPAFAILPDLTAQFPELRNQGPVNIEVQFAESLADPPYPHKHTYAFASITNNATQLFTTVTPQ